MIYQKKSIQFVYLKKLLITNNHVSLPVGHMSLQEVCKCVSYIIIKVFKKYIFFITHSCLYFYILIFIITVYKQFSRSLSEPLMQTDLCNSTKHFNGFLTEQDICVASGEMEASNVSVIIVIFLY